MPAISAPASGAGTATRTTQPANGPRRPQASREEGPAGAARARGAADRFARLLRKGPAGNGESGGEGSSSHAQLAAASVASWFRSEAAGPAAIDAVRVGVSSAPSASPPRLLVGGLGDRPEARIQIGAGPCAGAEIRLRAATGGVVEAELLTPTASSRQTLAVAMDEVGLRLRAKGVHLRGATGGGDERRRDRQQREYQRRHAQQDFGGDGG